MIGGGDDDTDELEDAGEPVDDGEVGPVGAVVVLPPDVWVAPALVVDAPEFGSTVTVLVTVTGASPALLVHAASTNDTVTSAATAASRWRCALIDRSPV